jgi:signal transduction histidine kinase
MAEPMTGSQHVTTATIDALSDDAQRRVDQLVDAVLALGSDLDLKAVLRRIVEVAVDLVDAQYGALGVMGEDGVDLSQFITVGIDDGDVEAIGPRPTGHGVLGEVIRTSQALRLTHLARHPNSSGFPANHPPMSSFLAVPVRVGQTVFGNLYLTEKRGGAAFTDQDEKVLVALAVAAGLAIRNSRLYDQTRQRGAWMEAGRVISTSLLSGTEREDVIALVVEQARHVLAADVALVVLSQEGRLQVETASGCDGPAILRQLADPLHQVLAEGHTLDARTGDLSGAIVSLGPPGLASLGALVVLWRQRPVPWDTTDLTGYAAQAAVALELADRRGVVERGALSDDRDRIGRDLHDLVIQRLFAVGMQLQSVVRLVDHNATEAKARVNCAVDELDETIRELRSTIYGLRAPMAGRPSLRAQVLQVIDLSTPALGLAPSVRLDGLLDTLATPEIAEHVLATLREALSNVARHAHARHVEVLVAVRGSTLQLRVEDDGVGMPADGARSGLVNVSSRAGQLGGHLRITSTAGGGTRLLWQVPV